MRERKNQHARSNSSYKHKKIPDKTWFGFSHQALKSPIKGKKKQKQTLNNIKYEFDSSTNKNLKKNSQEASTKLVRKSEIGDEKLSLLQTYPTEKKKSIKLHNVKINLKQPDKNKDQNSTNISFKNFKKKPKYMKKKIAKLNRDSEQEQPKNIVGNLLQNKNFELKRNKYMEKLKKKKNGKYSILPAKVERKLYNIKKRLHEKGLPYAVLNDIIKKERIKEEFKFRKTFNPSKLCFNCRQTGHVFADCPEKLNTVKEGIDICFKCGSHAHISSKCQSKVKGYSFVTCFVCKEQGHISRDCLNKEHGIYHKEKEPSGMLHTTINKAIRENAEITDHGMKTKQKSVKKQKVMF